MCVIIQNVFIKKKPRPCNDDWPVIAVMWNIGSVAPGSSTVRRLQISYDQVYSIKYFGMPMIPFWKHMYQNLTGLISNVPYEQAIQVL